MSGMCRGCCERYIGMAKVRRRMAVITTPRSFHRLLQVTEAYTPLALHLIEVASLFLYNIIPSVDTRNFFSRFPRSIVRLK